MTEATADEIRQGVLALLRYIATHRGYVSPKARSIYDPGEPLHDLKAGGDAA